MNLKSNQNISSLKESNKEKHYSNINKENNLLYSNDDIKIRKEIFKNNNLEIENDADDNKNDKKDDKTISNLLFLLKQMSDKQLYLLDVISNLQKSSSEQINNLNNRIQNLEEKIANKNDKYKYKKPEDDVFNNNYKFNENEPNMLLSRILNGNNNEELIKCLNGFNLGQIKKLDIKLIEDALMRLCILLTEGFKIHEIIGFIKGILIINKIKLKEITRKNLKDIFIYIQENLKNLKDEDSIDISLIISYLNKFLYFKDKFILVEIYICAKNIYFTFLC